MSEDRHAVNQRGIVAMVVAQAALVCGDCPVRHEATQLPPGEIMLLRGLVASAFVQAGGLPASRQALSLACYYLPRIPPNYAPQSTLDGATGLGARRRGC